MVSDELLSRKALVGFPYFVLGLESQTDSVHGINEYRAEIIDIARYYSQYEKGVGFQPEGSRGSYVPSDIRFKIIRSLINKEARFMFSRTPDIRILPNSTDDNDLAKKYQNIVEMVLEKCSFPSALIKAAKDCFIGKRVACLVDNSEEFGIQAHFYSSLEFYYDFDNDSNKVSKFISFECLNKSTRNDERRYLVNRYIDVGNKVYLDSIIYTGAGQVEQILFKDHDTGMEDIPVVIITNDGTLRDKKGISEVGDLCDYERGYSKLGNADIDSERKGMNPITYTVDMNPHTTKNLPTGAGAYWDLQSNQNIDDKKTSVGQISPQLNHTDSVKTTLERIENKMYTELDIPNINSETLQGVITSGKTLNALYFPLAVRCDEKMKSWKPAIESIVAFIMQFIYDSPDIVSKVYGVTELKPLQYSIKIIEHYALISDDNEEKEMDLQEVQSQARSRFSYIKKWRKDEFETDDQIDEEILRIAMEQNMFDTLSMNTQVQRNLEEIETQEEIKDNLEKVEI